MDKIVCPNCGAAIYENEPKCPFCGYINIAGAEEKFMRDMEQTEENLSQIPKLQKKHYKKSMSKSSKIILITVVVVAVLLLGIFALNFAFEAWMYGNYEYDAKAETLWERENYPLLDEMYAAGDYKGIVEFEESLYEVNDKEGTNHSIYNWEHADFIWAYRKYEYLQYYMDILDEQGELSKFQAENVVYYCMWFHYREYEDTYYNCTEEEVALMDEYREYSDEIFFNRLKFTEEEADKLHQDSLEYGYIDVQTCYKYARKIKDRFE